MIQPPLIQRTLLLNPALPEDVRRRLSGATISRAIPRAVRVRLRQPEDITVSEAAAKYRRVTPVDAKPGPWRNDLVPHAVEAMDLFQEPWIKEIWLCWPERTAKTNVMLNCAAATVRGVRNLSPGNIFWLEPAEDDTNIKTKIIPMFRESPQLKKFLSARADDTGKKLITFKHGVNLFPASANSARTMANYFGKYCFCNEPDKYPTMVGTETDPIKLIRKRGRDVRNSKFMFGSTPAGKFIYKGTMSCRQVKKLHNRCPHCGELILMDDDHLVIPAKATAEQVESGEVQVGYACNSCGTEWDEYDRELSYKNGQFVVVKGADIKKPLTVGLHASALPFPMIPLAEYAGKYLRSKDGDRSDKVDYSHGYKVEDYIEETKDRHEDAILALRDDRPRDVVPRGAQCLTIQADTQQRGFWYTVRAWGWGASTESWKIRSGYVETFDDLMAIASADYLDPDGKVYRPAAGIIDSGGGSGPVPQHSRTAEVYEFCRLNPLFRPVKGRRGGDPWSSKRLDYYPSRDGKKRPIPGGLNLYTIDTTLYKNMLAGKLAINGDDPGAFHLDADTGDDYARQMCVEYKDERGHWECPRGKDNHYWDCEVYGIALADMLQLKLRKKPAEKPAAPTEQKRIKPNFATGWKK